MTKNKTETKSPAEYAQELGELQFSAEQAAIVLGVDQLDADLSLAHTKGLLLGEAKVRASVLKLAQSGSSPAQKEYLTLVRDREIAARRQEQMRERKSKPPR